METNWVKVCEYINRKNSSKTWLQELLESNNIPFKEEVKSFWEGHIKAPSYMEKIEIYVPSEFKSQVEGYIKEYNNPQNMLINDIEELKNSEDTEDEAEKINKNQKIMKKILAGIVLAMVASIVIAGIFVK